MDIANNPIFYDDNYNEPFDILYPKKKPLDMLFCCVLNNVNNCREKKERGNNVFSCDLVYFGWTAASSLLLSLGYTVLFWFRMISADGA